MVVWIFLTLRSASLAMTRRARNSTLMFTESTSSVSTWSTSGSGHSPGLALRHQDVGEQGEAGAGVRESSGARGAGAQPGDHETNQSTVSQVTQIRVQYEAETRSKVQV